MIPRAFIIALALSQGSNDVPDGMTARVIEWGAQGILVLVLGSLLIRSERRNEKKDDEIRELNKATRDVLISDSKAIDAISKAIETNTGVIRELKR